MLGKLFTSVLGKLSGVTTYIIVALVALFLLTSGTFYLYYRSAEAQLKADQVSIANLQTAFDLEKKSFAQFRKDVDQAATITDNANKTLSNTRNTTQSVISRIKPLDNQGVKITPDTVSSLNTEISQQNFCISVLTGADAKLLGMTNDEFNKKKQICN
jgi:hypothetical protein